MNIKVWPRSPAARLVVSLWLLSSIAVGLVGAIAFWRAREALGRAVIERLSVIADLKEDALDVWVEGQRDATVALAELPQMAAHAEALTTRPEGSPERQAAHEWLTRAFVSASSSRPELEEIFLLSDVGGKVIASTSHTREGEYQVRARYFTEGRQGTFIENVYASSLTGKPTMTIATPVVDSARKNLGVLAAHLNLDRMTKIVLSRTGLGERGEIYLVDGFGVFISGDRGSRGDFPRGAQSMGIDAAVHGSSGAGLYLNYRGVPVIGVYRWHSPRGIAMLVELEQSEAFAPARSLAWLISVIGLTLSTLLTAGMYFMARPMVIAGPQR